MSNITAIIDDFIAPKCHAEIGILYRDDALLVINKPSGLLSLSGKNPLNKDSVHLRLVQQFAGALMAHRLDFGTSGLMLIALTKKVNAHLTKQFQNQRVNKRYIAHLYSDLESAQGTINLPIGKSVFPRQKICNHSGKLYTKVKFLLERDPDMQYTRVEFYPQTGRTHQLRLHSQAIGHPIIGCDLYANDVSQALANRLMLHASDIEFEHPVTHQILKISAPCPF